MGILARLVAKNQATGYTPDEFFDRFWSRIGISHSHSGVAVTEESALRFITVYSCVRVLAEALASLPLIVYRSRPDGGSDRANDHPVFDLLYAEPNDEMNTVTWREQQMGNLVISGNCYSIITRNGRGQAIDVYPVPWERCWPFRDPADWTIKYRVEDRGKYEVFPASEVFHIPGLGWDGIMGYSPIRMAAESIGVGMAAAEFAARFYGQGMNAGGIVEHPTELSDTAYERLKKDVEENWGGLHNAWKPIILEGGAKYSRVSMPMADAQFIETRKFSRDEICGLFRVPPHMIADLDRSTNNNIEQQSLEFVMYSLLPYVAKWENAINWKLFSKRDRQQGYYAKFNLNGLLRGDYLSRQQGLAIQRQNGVINADEWRALEEMNPIGGEAGTAYLVNGNMTPVSRQLQNPPAPTQSSGGKGVS
ncbi:portal protein [Alicyclobacillus contaminans]|uniref:phage portal protein n=1 Tax=Alicyclobacillus contaminans TaxID=392016 RepID=UPI000A02A3B1|nr:phage portal protein [Alicyclobacillus contaminans]GMA52060.1 portal protein [Alicyclobacillus contaminans]